MRNIGAMLKVRDGDFKEIKGQPRITSGN